MLIIMVISVFGCLASWYLKETFNKELEEEVNEIVKKNVNDKKIPAKNIELETTGRTLENLKKEMLDTSLDQYAI